MRHVAHEEAAQTKPISTISLIARLGAVERVPRTNFPGALAATQAMEVMKAIFLPGLNEKAIIARWRDAPGAHTMVNGRGRSTMTKHADLIDAPQRALAAPKSTGMRRHRRKAEIRQQVVQESQNGERRTITTMPATDVPTGMNLSTMTFGVGIGDKKSNYCLLDPEGRDRHQHGLSAIQLHGMDRRDLRTRPAAPSGQARPGTRRHRPDLPAQQRRFPLPRVSGGFAVGGRGLIGYRRPADLECIAPA